METAPFLPVTHSTASAAAVAAFVAEAYALPGPLDCDFLRRGFNDTYRLKASDGSRSVLRISGRRLRGEPDVASETAFLAYLEGVGLPVASAVPARDGGLFTHVDMPEGRRPAVLFRHLDGRVPGPSSADARAQGVTLARIHATGEDFAGRDAGNHRLDLPHLLFRPLSAILASRLLDQDDAEALSDLASRLAASVELLEGLTLTRCHGDCHGGNARIATQGAQSGEAFFFDFDDGGPGYLAYDLAVFLWAQVSFGRRGHAAWYAFIDGYRSVRSLSPVDLEAVHLFVPIRHLWLMGEYAAKTGEWGSEAVPATWVIQQLRFLQDWDSATLARGLFDR